MALSRELRRRLLSEDEPLAKRLKLAENAFASTDLRVAKKEDLVIRWLCRLVEENPDEVVWQTLRHCLEFKNTSADIILKSEVKQSLVQTLTEKLTNIGHSQLDNVLGCCQLLFASCEMQRYFQSKPESLGEFMKALFDSKASKDINSVKKCAADAVDCFVTCYKQSSTKDKFTEEFLREILFPACGLIDKNLNDRLGAEIHKCIQQLLFGKSRYSQFKDYDGEDENHFGRKLFDELRKNSSMADEESVIVVFLYVFRAAVSSYKADPGVIDVIFRNLVDSAGRVKVKLLTCLRDQLANVTFDYQNKIGETTLFEYLERFIDEILKSERLAAADYDAIAVIASLNPLIIEARLQLILNRILLEKKDAKTEIESYGSLMIAILEAEVRLRREQKLVPWMLTAVKQSIVNRPKNDLETDGAFPIEFKDRFSKSVSNMTSTQTTDLLRSLTFHLNSFCTENSESYDKETMTFLLRANVDLVVAYFKGVRIYDHSIPLAGQQKFIVALGDFGKVITILTDKVVSSKHNKKMIVPLLTVTWYWDNVLNLMKYYVPDAVSETTEFPISDARMKELIRKCANSGCKRAMNRILVQQMARDLKEEECPYTSGLLDGLEESWSIIIDENPHLVSSMNSEQVAELARLLLENLKSSIGECSEAMQGLKSESIQNDVRLVTTLVGQSFANIAVNLIPSTTKSVIGHIDVVKMLNNERLSKILKGVKKEYEKNEWTIMDGQSTAVIEHDLRILSGLPLTHLTLDLRTLILLVVYAIKKECGKNDAVTEFCTQIMLDVLEKPDIDIIDYIEPSMLMKELAHSRAIQRVVESSLRNVSSWETLKRLVKKSEADKECVAALLDCMERAIRSRKLKSQKDLFRKAEKKLSKKLLDETEAEMKDHAEVRRLTKALKVPVADNEIPEHLISVVKSTLDRVFVSEASTDEKLLAEGCQLVKVVLNRPSKFELSDKVLACVWPWVMKNPSKEIVWLLLQASKSEAMLSRVLTMLHKQTISGLNESNGSSFQNALVIWDGIMNVDMGPARNTLRISAILNILEALLITNISKESWPGVLRLVQSIFSKHSFTVQQDIDLVLLIAVRSLKEVELSACEDVLAICHCLVKDKAAFMTDRLPVLLLLYGRLVRLIVRESRKEQDSSRERQLRCLAVDVLKFTNTLVKLKKHLSRISPYVIADLVDIFSEGVIPSYVKGSLEDSVGNILSMCDHHAISLLSRALPAATQGIFKTLYETYSKFHKFTGKI